MNKPDDVTCESCIFCGMFSKKCCNENSSNYMDNRKGNKACDDFKWDDIAKRHYEDNKNGK